MFENTIEKLPILKPWANPTDDTLQDLQTSNEGISLKEAEIRLKKYGQNIFSNKEKVSMVSVFIEQFKSPLIFLLLGASVLTYILGKYVDMTIILLAVLVNVFLGFYREYHAENTLDKLSTYIKNRTRVIREGVEKEIDSEELVPGDIIELSYGSRVPADARLILVHDFRVDEAILTGESKTVEKNADIVVAITEVVAERKNIVYAGTLVVEGYAKAAVFATGNLTEIGKIAGIVSKTERAETPIQKGVGKLAWLIFFITILIVFGIFVLGIVRGEGIFDMLILSVAVAVGAVPEALPIALTVILAVGSERIATKKGVVRKLAAAETLGSTTLIMTDKTGTLTRAEMQLVGVYSRDHIIENKEAYETKHFSDDQKNIIFEALNNIDVTIEDREIDPQSWVFHGKPFEVNLARAGVSHGVGIDILLKNESSIIIPFNSTHKFSVSELDSRYIIMGAPDILLKYAKLTEEEFRLGEIWIEKISNEGKRLIGVATLDKSEGVQVKTIEDLKNITLRGVLTFYDPIREEVPEAIKSIEKHGIKMVLVTGDLKGTALAVAHSLKWLVNEDEVLTGNDLRNLSDEELTPMLSGIKIFARVTPEDKLRIGQLYRSLGEVVAMTGDGVNDAPALKAMDIGVSLGSGSDVAKSAADMVLLDDNFNTISLAIDEGRKILANIRKTFVYLMSNSLDSVFVIGGSLLVGLPIPLTALQIIWVNFFTGSLPALSFAFDEDLDKGKIFSTKSSKLIFTSEVKLFTFGIGIVSSLLLFFVYYGLILYGLEIELAKTILFVCLASYILVVAFSFRSLHSPLLSYDVFSNKELNSSVLVAMLLIILTVSIPYLQNIFGVVPIPLPWVGFILIWLVINILLVEVAKYLIKLNKIKN